MQNKNNIQNSEITKNVAVHAHIYYEDTTDIIVNYLKNIPFKFDLYITTDTQNKLTIIDKRFEILSNIKSKKIFITPNRGRNVAPMLVAVGKYLISHDIVLHIHSKKSLHNTKIGDGWFEYLYELLLGSSKKVVSIMNQFFLNKNLELDFIPGPSYLMALFGLFIKESYSHFTSLHAHGLGIITLSNNKDNIINFLNNFDIQTNFSALLLDQHRELLKKKELDKTINTLNQTLTQRNQTLTQRTIETEQQARTIKEIYSSKSWRITSILRWFGQSIKSLKKK